MDDIDKLLDDLEVQVTDSIKKKTILNPLDELNMIKAQLDPNFIPSIPRTKNLLFKSKLSTGKSETSILKTSTKMCFRCQEPIEKGGSILNGKFYHDEHFVCSECKKSLKGALSFEKESELYCERDYHAKFSPQCHYCLLPIKEVGIEALGKTFHAEHFFCVQCGINLSNQEYHEHQGKAFCKEDYITFFSSRCNGCYEPLLQDYISALGKTFHSKCFVCSIPECSKVLPHFGYFHDNKVPYCEYHFYEKAENVCFHCKEIVIGRCVVALGRKYHAAHFNCEFCKKQLDGAVGGYKERNEKAYCTSCHIKLFS